MNTNLDENYAGAFDGTLGFGKTPALIVVDMVQAYFEPSCPLYAEVDDALAATIKLIEGAREAKIPVLYTNVEFQAGGVDGGIFFRKVPVLKSFLAGSPLGAWPAGIAPVEGELVISKKYPSAFFGTSLASTLTAKGIDTLVICGLTTSGCIRATCIDTVSSGFIPIVVDEACGDRHTSPHEANLFDMNAKYADVISLADALAHFKSMSQVASHG